MRIILNNSRFTMKSLIFSCYTYNLGVKRVKMFLIKILFLVRRMSNNCNMNAINAPNHTRKPIFFIKTVTLMISYVLKLHSLKIHYYMECIEGSCDLLKTTRNSLLCHVPVHVLSHRPLVTTSMI